MATTITGGEGVDTLFGTADPDVIIGDAGDDWLIGGAGNDTLVGGLGSDVFVLDWTDGVDLIPDYDPAVDRIRILNAPDQPPARLWSTERQGGGTFLQMQGGPGVILPGVTFESLFAHADRIEGTTLSYGIPGHPPRWWGVNIIDMDAVEGESFTFEVNRGGIPGLDAALPAQTAYWSLQPDGWPNPTDAADFGGFPSGRVEFAAGQTRAEVSVHALRDATPEGDESVTVAVSFPNAGYAGPLQPQVEGILRNDNAASTPLQHYLSVGLAEENQAFASIAMGRAGGFDRLLYLDRNPDVAEAGIDPQQHFDLFGWREGRDPNAWFDTRGYLAANADVAAWGGNPWTHYLNWGWQEGRDPSREFDTGSYLAANPDVAAAGMNPLLHFLQFGQAEGRVAVSDLAWG